MIPNKAFHKDKVYTGEIQNLGTAAQNDESCQYKIYKVGIQITKAQCDHNCCVNCRPFDKQNWLCDNIKGSFLKLSPIEHFVPTKKKVQRVVIEGDPFGDQYFSDDYDNRRILGEIKI